MILATSTKEIKCYISYNPLITVYNRLRIIMKIKLLRWQTKWESSDVKVKLLLTSSPSRWEYCVCVATNYWRKYNPHYKIHTCVRTDRLWREHENNEMNGSSKWGIKEKEIKNKERERWNITQQQRKWEKLICGTDPMSPCLGEK